MTDVEDEVNKMDELIKKLNRCNINVKLILEMLKKMNEKKESKETTDYKKSMSKRIQQPKETTIQYYKSDYDMAVSVRFGPVHACADMYWDRFGFGSVRLMFSTVAETHI